MESTAPSIRFTLTKGDLFWLQLKAALRNRIVWIMYLVFLAIALNGLLSAPSIQDRSLPYRVLFGCFVAVLFSIPFWLLQLLVVFSTVFGKKHQGVVGEHVVTIMPDGLAESTAFNSGLQKWAGIHRVESQARYLVIYVNEYAAHYIPKRAFPTATEAELFEQHVRRAVAQSKTSAPSHQ